MSQLSLIARARKDFHKRLLASILQIDDSGVPGNADRSSASSCNIASGIAQKLLAENGVRTVAQTSGNKFEEVVALFISNTFPNLSNLRPGTWDVRQIKSRGGSEISKYSQYEHLAALTEAAKGNLELSAALGNDYTITPDVVITRQPETDAVINSIGHIVDSEVALRSDLRDRSLGRPPLLHASISTKWTLRSDRAQNARSEALNLIRNRKGRQPHIVVVTGEPTPSRLASLALGTGDIDCVYHFALHELIETVSELSDSPGTKISDSDDLLRIMVEGKRLKDISDLPLDLAV
ncbi:NgoMIV family type II restriction endonuclease [Solilutibacter tolerans]|uniref:NgoMIV restriction enzyme n=1 Tax=Solilutibacter tolerans TaxID=1604334 RepID=A0A1N6QNI4_9GAMM|nr:NgoMIV family type II restriction endonuclease [Lysobacter tolerans]SIQ18062.1 NgoMIV restriction enzyme [Lysobacter tolerans]